MVLIAGAIGGLIHLIVPLVAVGVWVINALMRKRDEEGEVPRRQTPLGPPVHAGANPMEPQDVDQFLDEVLGRGAAAKPVGQPQAAQPVEVIVLRPGAPPPPPLRPRPAQRRSQRPAAQRPAQARRSVAAQPPAQPTGAAKSAFSQAVQQSVDQAADATGSAGAAAREAGTLAASSQTSGHRVDIGRELLGMMRSPADIRRAILLREILGPPLALRRRKI